MAEHAKAIAKAAEPDRAEPGAAATARHELLEGRPEERAVATAARMLNARPALAVQRATVETLSRRPATGPRPIQREVSPAQPDRSGMPNGLKAGVEALSGVSMGDVRVYRNSTEPAKLGALAYAQGGDIHLGPGQERHLPHEAWHVVQQKQGRVRPTLQLKGLAIDDQPELEREADTMGRLAAASVAAPDGSLSNASPRRDLVQRKVFHGGSVVAVPPLLVGKNSVLEEYAAKDEEYLIRDDSLQALEAAEIHLLEEKVYLLGERHGDGTWQNRTALWTAPKMKEGNKEIPKDPSVPRPQADVSDQALESAHAFALAFALSAVQAIARLAPLKEKLQTGGLAAWQAIQAHLNSSPFYTDVGQLHAVSAKYLEFIDAYDQAPGEKSDGAKAVYAFAKKIVGYSDEFADLSGSFQETQKLMKEMIANGSSLSGRIVNFFSVDDDMAMHYFDKIIAAKPIFADLAIRLGGLVNLPAEEAAPISELMQGGAGGVDATDLANPARERAMVANIVSAGRPLLVKIGNFHVDSVADAVGDGAVRVKKGDSFDAVTIRRAADQGS